MKESDIIHLALENLDKNTKIKGTWRSNEAMGQLGQLELEIDKKVILLNTEIRNELRNHQLSQINALGEKYAPLIVVAGRIFPNLKNELRNRGIAHLDTSGNLYLKLDGVFLWIESLRAVPAIKSETNGVFTKTGIKLLYHILLNEELINMSYREIASFTKVGLANINSVMNGLKNLGFLIKLDESRYSLKRKNDLMQKWAIAYSERLKPALFIGSFRFVDRGYYQNWKELTLGEGKNWWGGEPAADILTNYLQPGEYTIYSGESKMDLIKKFRLIPDNSGDVRVYNKFWQNETEQDNIVSPLLIYADLINSQDSRCLETAQKIYETFLKNEIDGD